jgi:hypothetical protein
VVNVIERFVRRCIQNRTYLTFLVSSSSQDLSRNVAREVSKMDSVCMAPAVYGYRPVTSAGGAFGSTFATSQKNTTQVLKRVDIGFKKNAGLFHEF